MPIHLEGKHIYTIFLALKLQGPVPERRNNSIPGINVPYFRDDFLLGINYVPENMG